MSRREMILCACAAAAGLVLMVFELVAARILAPSIGSSMYVWTSVIGVIVAALSVGYWLGGRVADKRNAYTDIAWLFVAVGLSILMTIQLYPQVLSLALEMQVDSRVRAVIVALVLFAPTSLLLGAISPYLAKLNVKSLGSTGRSVANLGAINSLGGIVGTFLAGFFLFGWIGAREVLVYLAIVTVLMSWVIAPRRVSALRVYVSLGIVVAALVSLVPSGPKTVDTPSAHYVIADVPVPGGALRTLVTGPIGGQSAVFTADPDKLAFWYTGVIADAVAAMQTPRSILVLGGGAYTLPRHLAHTYPDAQIDVVEIDPKLIEIARSDFFYDDPANVRTYADDARAFLNTTTLTYDVVIVDVFGGDSVPGTLMTKEYGRILKKVVNAEGAVVVNSIAGFHGACQQLRSASLGLYHDNFDYAYYLARDERARTSNILSVYSDSEQAIAGFAPERALDGRRYTDNFIPSEALYTNCRSQV